MWHLKNLGLINSLFIETNPLPVKTILANEGFINEEFRLPLCKMNENKKTELIKIYNKWITIFGIHKLLNY
jgi:4-hydroxy-tetrahydrodipicolinate synthase